MKIDKEKFNKLKQLDRIEYRQKYSFIESGVSSSLIISFILICFSLLFIILNSLVIGIIFLIFAVLLNFKTKRIAKESEEKLEQEYFIAEVKKK